MAARKERNVERMAGRTRQQESSYASLAREVRKEVLQGRYADGRRLPTEAEFAARYQVSRQTVRRAFQDLVAEGMVYRVPGRGTFAALREGRYLRQFGSIDDLMGLSIDTSMQLVEPLHRQVDLDAAGRLQLSADRVDKLAFLRLHDDTPFCMTTVYLPPAVGALLASVPELAETGARSQATIIGLLDGRMTAPIAEAEQSITVGRAPVPVAKHLGCDPDAALLRIDRLYLSSAGHPVELAISYFLPEHYSYRVRLRRNLR